MAKIQFRAVSYGIAQSASSVRFPGRLPGLAQSSDRLAVKWLPELAGTSPRRIRRRLQRAGRGTAQELESNAFGQESQRGWGYSWRTKEAFPPHSERHTLFLEYSGGPPHMTQRASESLVAALIRVGLLLALAIMLMAENAQAQPASPHSRTGHTTRLQSRIDAASTRTSRTA